MNSESGALQTAAEEVARRLRSLRPRRKETLDYIRDPAANPLKRCQHDNLPVLVDHKRRRGSGGVTPPPTPASAGVATTSSSSSSTSTSSSSSSSYPPPLIPADLVSRLSAELLNEVLHVAAITSANEHQFTYNVSSLLVQCMNEVSPSSEACSSSSTSSSSGAPNSGLSAGGSSSATCPRGGGAPSNGGSGSGSGSSGRPTVSSRDRRSIQSTRSAQLRSLSPAYPSPFLDDMLRPERFHRIMRMPAPDRFVQEQHSWNPDDRSLNIIVKEEDKFTFHRHPVAQSTDCIRGKIGYSRGFHVWQIEWPERQRGTHAVVGVATKTAPLHATGYTALIGTTTESYGWDITRKECHHDSKHTMTWGYPGNSRETNYVVPDKFYCILDMDEGYMAFATDHEYLGVAFRNLKGKTLYPIVAAVWGHCEISMRYLGSLEPAPLSLSELCRRRVRIQLGAESEHKIEQLGLPPFLKQYLMYRY